MFGDVELCVSTHVAKPLAINLHEAMGSISLAVDPAGDPDGGDHCIARRAQRGPGDEPRRRRGRDRCGATFRNRGAPDPIISGISTSTLNLGLRSEDPDDPERASARTGLQSK